MILTYDDIDLSNIMVFNINSFYVIIFILNFYSYSYTCAYLLSVSIKEFRRDDFE